jgi:hypothetical protein
MPYLTATTTGPRRALQEGVVPTRLIECAQRVTALVTEDAGCVLRVLVNSRCGGVEVRISGPRAVLRVVFDDAELHPAFVRHSLRRALARYRASLASAGGEAPSRGEW